MLLTGLLVHSVDLSVSGIVCFSTLPSHSQAALRLSKNEKLTTGL